MRPHQWLFMTLLTLPLLVHAGKDWKQVEDRDGIKVYSKDIPDSNRVAFRGDGVIDAPMDKVASVMFDFQRAKEWVKDLEETQIIHWYSDTEFLEYDHVHTPLIISDRDFLSKVKMHFDKDKQEFSFTYENGDPADAPEKLRKTRYVRGALNGSFFTLSAVEGGKKTKVAGEVYGDPKGSIPSWIVNLFQEDWPRHTLISLRKQVAKPDINLDPKIEALMNPPAKP